MTTETPTVLVPPVLPVIGEEVRVERAWPVGDPTGDEMRLRVEGRDAAGRLRAGHLGLVRQDGWWRPRHAELLPAGEDPRLPDLAELAAGGELLVHRAGRRAVVRLDGHRDAHGQHAKVLRPGGLDPALRAAERGVAMAAAAGWAAPTPRAGEGSVLLTTTLPGAPLHDLGRTPGPAWDDVWQAWADGWPRLAAAPAEGLPEHTADDEARVVTRWARWAAHALGEHDPVAGALPGLAGGVAAALRDPSGRTAPVLAHRDLHDKQLLADGTALGLLDVDTAALAERELDLANLHEHVALRARQGWWPASATAAPFAAVAAAAHAVDADPRRLAAYRAATRLRVACLYLFRPSYEAMARTWLRRLVDDERPLTRASSVHHVRGADWSS